MGSGDVKRGCNVFSQTMLVTCVVSVLVGAVSFVFFEPMLRFLRAEGNVFVFARDYYFIMLFEYPVMILNTSFGMFIRSDGRPNSYMKINILNKGDKVLNVTENFIAVERKNGEVDIVPLAKDENGFWIDVENITTIGYGNKTVQSETVDGVVITNF